jgi:hypothetical protein
MGGGGVPPSSPSVSLSHCLALSRSCPPVAVPVSLSAPSASVLSPPVSASAFLCPSASALRSSCGATQRALPRLRLRLAGWLAVSVPRLLSLPASAPAGLCLCPSAAVPASLSASAGPMRRRVRRQRRRRSRRGQCGLTSASRLMRASRSSFLARPVDQMRLHSDRRFTTRGAVKGAW